MLSVIIPANNEADYIGFCLDALLSSIAPAPSAPGVASEGVEGGPVAAWAVEIVVVANACADATVSVARERAAAAAAKGWRLAVLDIAEGGKLNALNVGDRKATGSIRVYVDADVIVSPGLLGQLCAALDRSDPAYASGRPTVPRHPNWFTRAYVRLWLRVPFMTECVPGCGVFAVNAAGRARWGAFPDIISDDTFVRLSFAPEERISVPAPYSFPMCDGFSKLVRVRRRQNVGVEQVAQLYPELTRNDDKPRVGLGRAARLAVSDPIGFIIYGVVSLAVRLPSRETPLAWTRGR